MQRWLKARAEDGHLWLLYFDAAEEPGLIKELLSWNDILHLDRGHVLITSRVTGWSQVFRRSHPDFSTPSGIDDDARGHNAIGGGGGGAKGTVGDIPGNGHSIGVDRSMNHGPAWKFDEVALALMSTKTARKMILQ